MLTLQAEGRDERRHRPHDGHAGHAVVTNFVLRDGDAYAVAQSFLLRHEGPEVVHQVTLGTWPQEDAPDWPDHCDDHLTFACHVAPSPHGDEVRCSLLDAHPGEPSPVWGRVLTADQARSHPRLPELWEVVELVSADDPAVGHHLGHA